MTAAKRDIVIEKGATYIEAFRLRYKSTGAYLDLTGYIGRMQVREKIADLTPALDINGADFTFDAIGNVGIRVSAARTTAITIAKGVYDCEIEAPDGTVIRLAEGKAVISPNVTRPAGVNP